MSEEKIEDVSKILETPRKKKLIEERNVKSCVVQIVGKRFALNPDTLKIISAFFEITGTYSIDSNKRFSLWTLTKIIRPYKFSWMQEHGMKTRLFVHDSEGRTVPLSPMEETPFGIECEMSEPKRITKAEAEKLIAEGAFIFELDENDQIRGLAIVKFG